MDFSHEAAATDYPCRRASGPSPTSVPSHFLLSNPVGFVANSEGIIWRVRMTSNPPHSRHKNEPAVTTTTTGSDTTPLAPAEEEAPPQRRLVISILDPWWHVPLGARSSQRVQTQPASRSAVNKSIVSHSDRHCSHSHCCHSLVLICWIRALHRTEASSVAMAPFSSPAVSSSSVSSPVVLVSIMPRAEPVSLSHHPKKTHASSDSALWRWDFVCDVVAQMLLLPMVCVSVCGAVGLLLGLECMEKLQRLPFQRAHHQQQLQQRRASHQQSTRGCIAGANANRDQKKEEGRRDDDAAARRPLKKQRSSTNSDSSSSTSASSNLFTTSDNNRGGNPLETRPFVHKASAKHKKQVTRRRRVFIWDLDETLVLFASLYTGAFAQAHGKEIAAGVQLGEQMMTFMLAMLERHFFFNDLHDADIDHIHCLRNGAAAAGETNNSATAGPRPSPLAGVAARYERIREIYEREGTVDFLSDERSEWFAIREALVAAIDAFSTGWLQEARQVLELLTSSTSKVKEPTMTSAAPVNEGEAAVEYENINLMVTNTQLAPALCKCLIYQLDAFFPIESVYSSSKLHKQHCFEQILRTYSSSEGDTSVEFIAIGDGAEEEHVSRALGIQFHKIRSLADLKRLRFDLQLEASDGRTGSSL